MKYSDAEQLLELGLISREQCDAIIDRLKLSPAASRNYLLIAFSCLGGVLVLAGIILLISANWAEIPPLVKQISAAALMLAFWIFGLRFVCRKENPRPLLGESLCFVGAGMWLGNIALYGQIYQISSEPSKAIGAWFLGIFLLPWLVRLRGVFLMSLVAAFIWLCCKAEEAIYPADNAYYFHFLAFFAAISALGIFLSNLKNETRERVRGYGPLAAWTAFPALVLLTQPFCYSRLFDYAEVLCAGALTLVPASLILGTSLLFSFRKKLGALGGGAAILLGAFPLVPLGLGYLDPATQTPDDVIHALMMGALFVCGNAAMVLGAKVAKKFYVNLGAMMIFLSAIALAIEVVGSLTSSGLALIAAGVFLIIVGYVLERQRRKITAKIKEDISSSITL
ncbi:MAG: DUF2157 domain-containing protein [Opitutales bacterium]|nr:DUF2157 domain-containing protein [Opitutales bacterium]